MRCCLKIYITSEYRIFPLRHKRLFYYDQRANARSAFVTLYLLYF